MIKSEHAVKTILGQDQIDIITGCIERGFARYFELPPEARVDFAARSRASVINDFIRAEARKRFFESETEIRLYEIRGLFLVDFGEVQLRFKKLNKRLRPQNIPTRQTLAFMGQETLWGQRILPGVELPTKVVAGYQPDASFSSIKYMGILCFPGASSEYLWKLDLEKTFKIPTPLHAAKSDEQEPTKERVTPKEGVKDGRKRTV